MTYCLRLLLTTCAWLAVAPGTTISATTAGDADKTDFSAGGHFKYQYLHTRLPDDSLFQTLKGNNLQDHQMDLRLNFSLTASQWDFRADYQLLGLVSDRLELARLLPGTPFPVGGFSDDSRRWWDLTHVIDENDKWGVLHRLDRISIGFTTANSAWRFGRQAISWGNGMIYTPMDIFNPFDPVAIDKEYKSGDDMLYGQLLRANGDDIQAVAVVRRDPLSGEVESDQGSVALKYHGFAGTAEYDLLAARHFDETVLGVGGGMDIAGAVWRGDLTWTDSSHGGEFSLVTSISHAWVWGNRNVTGLLEYYHNGFGQNGGRYEPQELTQNPDLLQRLARGELYALARHYLAASASVEVSPLLVVSPNLFVNLQDPSALLQIVARYDWQQNLLLTGSLNLPVGSNGTEYGGIPSPVPERYFSTGVGVFVQLARYF